MFGMTVQDVFVIRGRGAVATGHVEWGQLRVGDEVQINGAYSESSEDSQAKPSPS
jgi:translation elongation factor EF-Tu-like GTPase